MKKFYTLIIIHLFFVVKAQTYLMNNTTVNLTCPSTSFFYDSGNSGGNYSNGENFTKTFNAPAGSCLSITLQNINIENCCDYLRIYDGPNTASPLIVNLAGTIAGPVTYFTTGSSMTFDFHSDGSLVYAGWQATITCVSACSGPPTPGTAALTATNCAASSTVNLSTSGVTPLGCGITYVWQSAPAASGPWTTIAGSNNLNPFTTTISATTFFRMRTQCNGANSVFTNIISANAGTTPIPCALSTYTSALITCSIEAFAGTTLPTTDDVLFNSITMFGFPVCFGGSQYWGGYVASNGAFVFDGVPCYPNIDFSTYAAGGVWTGYTIPNPAPTVGTSIPRNAILGPWQDINPSLGGTIRYYTTGTAPNRKFVVSYESIPMYSCGTSSPAIYYTGQIKIYETTNIIEIHVGNKGVCPGFNNGEAVMGLHSFDGTTYIPPVNATAHNAMGVSPYNQWTMSNRAYRFNSPCASSAGPCVVLPIGFVKFKGDNIDKYNKLSWTIEKNSNFKNFSIERSLDGVNFAEIGTVSASNATEYDFNDETHKPFTINYYRITGFGQNEQQSKTYIIPIGSNGDNFEIGNVFPNPTSKSFNVQINSKSIQQLKISVCNSIGVEMYNEYITTQLGYSEYEVNVENLSTGLYIVKFSNKQNQHLSEQKLMITK
jgi:hypothetical protein